MSEEREQYKRLCDLRGFKDGKPSKRTVLKTGQTVMFKGEQYRVFYSELTPVPVLVKSNINRKNEE